MCSRDVEHGHEVPLGSKRLIPIDKADPLGKRKLGDIEAGAVRNARYIRRFYEGACAVTDLQHRSRNFARETKNPAKSLIPDLDGSVAQVLIIGDVFLVVLYRGVVDLVDHTKAVHLVIV